MRTIDADALKKALEDMCSASNDIKQRRIEDIMLHNIFPQIIDDEPTLDYAPVKHGLWKWDGCIVRCTVCNERPPDDWQTDFCPNCGARMDGDSE